MPKFPYNAVRDRWKEASVSKLALLFCPVVSIQYRLVTDEQTDRRTDRQTDRHTTTANTAQARSRAVKSVEHTELNCSPPVIFCLFKHQRQRAQATYMPVKSSTMNIYMLDNETR